MKDEYFYFIIYWTNYFKKGQKLNRVFCINRSKTPLATKDNGTRCFKNERVPADRAKWQKLTIHKCFKILRPIPGSGGVN